LGSELLLRLNAEISKRVRRANKMAYFPNGSSAEDYQCKYCDRCQHWPENPDHGECAVWLAHILYSYEECNNDQSILNILIPEDENGWPKQCEMFIERDEDPR
jgi:hypothetical protein